MSSTVSFAGYTCRPEPDGCYGNGRPAIRLVDYIDGSPIVTASLNIPHHAMDRGEVAIKDYAENEGMLAALLAAEIVHPPHRQVQNGYVQIPICRLRRPFV